MTAVLVCLAALLGLSALAPFWGWVMIVPFAYGAARAASGWRAARTGLAASGLLWLGAAAYLYAAGGSLIAGRMAAMFGLGRGGTMIAVTGLAAALAGGLGGYAGYAVRAAIGGPGRKEQK